MEADMKAYLEDRLPRIEKGLQRFYDRLGSNKLLRQLETVGSINPDTFRKALYEPSEESVFTGGKRIRPVLVHLTHDLVGGKFGQIDDVAIMPELCHKGTIVIDDIQDKALKRDGKDPLYKSHGMATALNVGNFLYFVPELVLDGVKIDEKTKSEILQDYLHAGLVGHIGQGSDIYWKETQSLPTEKEYLQMCAYKAFTFNFAARLGAILGEGSEEQKNSLAKIAGLTATAYQLKDDLLSLSEGSHDYGDDIIEGKITLTALRTIQGGGRNAEILRGIFSSRASNTLRIRDAIEIMRDSGSIDYTEQRAGSLVDKAVQKLFQDFPESTYRAVLSELIEYCGISRER